MIHNSWVKQDSIGSELDSKPGMAGGLDGNDPGSTSFSNYFGENAPGAETFWVKWAQDCLAHSDMSNLA